MTYARRERIMIRTFITAANNPIMQRIMWHKFDGRVNIQYDSNYTILSSAVFVFNYGE